MAKYTSDVDEDSTASELDSSADELTAPADNVPQHGFFVRLYTGTGAFDVIGKRRFWYAVSGVIVAVCVASMVLRGFTFGIDFEGGTKVSLPATGATGSATRRLARSPAARSARAWRAVSSSMPLS